MRSSARPTGVRRGPSSSTETATNFRMARLTRPSSRLVRSTAPAARTFPARPSSPTTGLPSSSARPKATRPSSDSTHLGSLSPAGHTDRNSTCSGPGSAEMATPVAAMTAPSLPSDRTTPSPCSTTPQARQQVAAWSRSGQMVGFAMAGPSASDARDRRSGRWSSTEKVSRGRSRSSPRRRDLRRPVLAIAADGTVLSATTIVNS